jgi:hypothetical protein
MTNWQKTSAAGLALIAPAYCGLMLSGVPTLLCPFPFVTIVPVILAAVQLHPLAVLFPTTIFFLWCPKLFQGQEKIPTRSFIFLGVLTVLTAIWFISSWSYGLQYQGPAFTYGTCAVNIGWIILLWSVFTWARGNGRFHANLLAHFLLFAWLGWYAFPYLGELP